MKPIVLAAGTRQSFMLLLKVFQSPGLKPKARLSSAGWQTALIKADLDYNINLPAKERAISNQNKAASLGEKQFAF